MSDDSPIFYYNIQGGALVPPSLCLLVDNPHKLVRCVYTNPSEIGVINQLCQHKSSINHHPSGLNHLKSPFLPCVFLTMEQSRAPWGPGEGQSHGAFERLLRAAAAHLGHLQQRLSGRGLRGGLERRGGAAGDPR